jgi:hypothetical protein
MFKNANSHEIFNNLVRTLYHKDHKEGTNRTLFAFRDLHQPFASTKIWG